ncbi:uncharacterized protein LACBIDRAFT_335463 [Laccaria bicolor S238N-H82]|uniref:Uncharacterized protein n=1 Tax=Laccaria bicolor (strain S238N-H82 / ATCC MYA-4686) TaxID=486041 RepID=B0E2D9_LACBS|nr:uncharacterized protein LACBIDRAFT_335463 [Laccaria bicolor S238N-H82]EDQ98998.1 hypothetical protein LACBIDRAFT_335463 [Laccaria bicolor S238N-H82]|eukprot:XP_001890359.1 hypothetical protein LACBIDRAFT_335463 [Laccaria bicolor S238N-H82]
MEPWHSYHFCIIDGASDPFCYLKLQILHQKSHGLDEQTAALTLAKDQITANEVKSAVSHDTSVIVDILRPQAGVQEIVHNLRTELAVAHEQKLALERETANLKASFNQLTRESAASLAAAQVDFEKKLNRQEKANERLVSAQEKRAVAAEKAATLAENDAKEARAAREELAGRLALAEMSVIAIAEDGEAAATRESGQMKVMKARAEELEARVGEMTKHAETLLSRYHDGNLTDSEKDLGTMLFFKRKRVTNRTSLLRIMSFEKLMSSYTATGVQNPAVVTALIMPSPQEEVSVSTSPAVQRKASDGPVKTRQKKRK